MIGWQTAAALILLSVHKVIICLVRGKNHYNLDFRLRKMIMQTILQEC